MYFRNFDIFVHMLIFTIIAFRLISGVLIFAKFVEFLKRVTVSGGRYFLIFQSKYMLNLCLNLNESQLINDFKRYGY